MYKLFLLTTMCSMIIFSTKALAVKYANGSDIPLGQEIWTDVNNNE